MYAHQYILVLIYTFYPYICMYMNIDIHVHYISYLYIGAFSIRPASVGAMSSTRNIDNKEGGLNISRNLSHVKAWKALDSSNQVLQQRYKIASKNTTTNQEEYGLFIKNVKKAKKQQHRLRTKLINKNGF
jgi:hypothetical protein